MLASAKSPNNNKVHDVDEIEVEFDQDKAAINQSEQSINQEPDVPPETIPAKIVAVPKSI